MSNFDIIIRKGNQSEAARPSVQESEGIQNPPDERKEGDAMYITFSDLIQFSLFIVTLVVACYTIFKDRKN